MEEAVAPATVSAVAGVYKGMVVEDKLATPPDIAACPIRRSAAAATRPGLTIASGTTNFFVKKSAP